jgi:glycosyltransferase involved in cell wall biosynthesis
MADLSGLHILCVPSWWPSAERPISGIFFTDYVRAFAKAGACVGVVFPDLVSVRYLLKSRAPISPRLTWESIDDIPVVRIRGWHTALGRPSWQMGRYLKWLRWGLAEYTARHGTPDALHAMISIPAGWACAHLEGPWSRRIVLTEETGPFSLVMSDATNAAFVRESMAKAATVVTVSEHARADIRSHGIEGAIEVCGNPVAREFCDAVVTERARDGPIRALYVGRLVNEKGVIELAEAATRIGSTGWKPAPPGHAPAIGRSHTAMADVEWHFAGDGPANEQVRATFRRNGMSNRLHLHGLCDRARIRGLMEQCDFLVHPTYGETFGQSAAEALCMGLPVVTTRGTACAEFIHETNGLLVERRDVDSLVIGIQALIQGVRSPGSFNRTAIAEQARRRFSGEAVADQYAAWFRSAKSQT